MARISKPNTANQQTSATGMLVCPKCGAAMVPMNGGRGFRCATPGNRWSGKSWSICDGVIWNKSGGSFAHFSQKPVDRAAGWLQIAKPTQQQLDLQALASKAPEARKGRCIVTDAGPGTAKTSTQAWCCKSLYERLGNLQNFPFLAFNRNARDVLLTKLPQQVPDVQTMNQAGARAQGLSYNQYDSGKLRRIYKDLTSNIPWDDRPQMGQVGTFCERMADLCLYNPSESDTSWWQEAIIATVERFPGMQKKFTGQEKHCLEYVPAVATRCHAEGKKVSIQEQITRPIIDAISRTGWRMPTELVTKKASDWTQADVDHFCKLVRSVQVPQQKGIVLDEAQDLSPCQIALFLAMVWKSGELFLVGDDKTGNPGEPGYKAGQGIYRWRGAMPGGFDLISRLWLALTGENPIRRELTTTFRCAPEIVDAFRPLHSTLTSARAKGTGAAWQVSQESAFTAWLALPKDKSALWITRTNAPLSGLLIQTLKAQEDCCIRGGGDFLGQIDGALYPVAGWRDESTGDYKVSLAETIAGLKLALAEQNGSAGENPDSLESFLVAIGEAIQVNPELLRKANLPEQATTGNLRKFIAFFADKTSRRVLSTVYRCKGDEADMVIVSDAEKFNQAWAGDEDEAAACRLVALSRGRDLLLTVGHVNGSVMSPAPGDEVA